MKNPIVQRELMGVLRTRKAFGLQVALTAVFALLVVLRWPSDAQIGLSGAPAREMFQLFGYGLLTALILLVPAFPATGIVREKNSGTLALLLNSPLGPGSIYLGKLLGSFGFALLLLVLSLPAAAACYAMGGISLTGELAMLYAVLLLVALQYTAVALLVSTYSNSTDSALRVTYGVVLLMAVVSLGPHQFLQGQAGWMPTLAGWLRNLSPLPAMMELLGHGGVGAQGIVSAAGNPVRYCLLALGTLILFPALTIARLNYGIFDRSRAAGKITDEQSAAVRGLRRLVFLVDPQRRSRGIGRFTNPVMVKEFRCRRFGRSHWLLRLIFGSALVSLLLTYATTAGSMDWGAATIGGIMVLLQVALLVLLTPSLAAGLVSTERESGGWELLQMTPMSTARVLRGKLISVLWPLGLLLLATLPGYLVMIWIQPGLWGQISQVLICLGLTAVFALLLSASVGSLFRRTAPATATAYTLLIGICAGTMLFWLGRDAPFGHDTVEAALTVNPMAAALTILEVPGFTQYNLVPANWWFIGISCLAFLTLLGVQSWRLSRPR